ncbi:MAG TPA: hypothetical protein VGR07_04930, partial [Thermoanaerobaculia bacterium]|nr:hypothetical protein [Thermoanaerobaculia bacterium]
RLLDTRQTGTPLTGNRIVTLTGAPCGLPANAAAVALNATAINATSKVSISLFPGDAAPTGTYAISANPSARPTVSAEAVVGLATDAAGTLTVAPSFEAPGQVDLTLDVTGYFVVNKLVYTGFYVEVDSGAPQQPLEYRILRGTTTIADFRSSIPSHLPDGVHAGYIDPMPIVGIDTYVLQARSDSGSVTIGNVELFAQTIPGAFTLFEGSAANVVAPADATWRTVVSSGFLPMKASSIGAYGTNGHGFATVTYSGVYSKEALLRFQLSAMTEGWSFEVGTSHVHGSSGQTRLEALASDWEQIGMNAGSLYRIDLQADGLCTTSQSLGFSQVRFQVLALPDVYGFVTPEVCQPQPRVCCANNSPPCTAYTCVPSGELAVTSSPGSLQCPQPP